MRILVVEDEAELRMAIVRRLRAQGYAVDEAEDSAEADAQRSVYDYGVIVLDRMLPDGDSVERLNAWREQGIATPVILLTARDRVEDRIDGLDAGADDYVVKPFAMEELLARVRAIARRGETPEAVRIQIADLELDYSRREVRRGGVLLPLRPKEFALLELLVSQRGRVVTRTRILDGCWDEAHEPASNVEEVLIAALRRKLGKPALIRTVRGMGYMLDVADGAMDK